MGRWELSAGDTAKAEQYTLQALNEMLHFDSSKVSEFSTNYVALNIYEDLAKYALWRNDYKQAYFYTTKQMAAQEKLLNAKTTEKINKAESEFTKQKILQENAANKKAFYFTLALSLLALATFLTLVMLYRSRLKQALQSKLLLEAEAQHALQEKKNAQILTELEKEKSARLGAEQEVMQQKNETLQKEVMTSSVQLTQKDELLREIKETLANVQNSGDSGSLLKNVLRSIESHHIIDNDIADYKEKVAAIHPDFFTRLQVKAGNKLTDIDLKYCMYIYLGISSKNMAAIMRVDQKSIRMAKYRIKQKLNLGKDEELSTFIEQVV